MLEKGEGISWGWEVGCPPRVAWNKRKYESDEDAEDSRRKRESSVVLRMMGGGPNLKGGKGGVGGGNQDVGLGFFKSMCVLWGRETRGKK